MEASEVNTDANHGRLLPKLKDSMKVPAQLANMIKRHLKPTSSHRHDDAAVTGHVSHSQLEQPRSAAYRHQNLLSIVKNASTRQPAQPHWKPPVVTMVKTHFQFHIEPIVSFVAQGVNLACLLRLPYCAVKYGGVVFLIPFFIFGLLFGYLIAFLQMALGQYGGSSVVTVWHCLPLMKGVGLAAIVSTFFISVYYSTILSWVAYYLFVSFKNAQLPWSKCNTALNESFSVCEYVVFPECVFRNGTGNSTASSLTLFDVSRGRNDSNTQLIWTTLPAYDYIRYQIFQSIHLKTVGDEHHLGLILCFVIVWCVIAVCLVKGAVSAARCSLVTLTLATVLAFALLIALLFVDGATDGLMSFVRPSLSHITTMQLWGEALLTSFLCVFPSWGTTLTIGGYQKPKVPFQYYVLAGVPWTLGLSTLFAMIPAVLVGILARALCQPVSAVITEGIGLVFVVAAQGLALTPTMRVFSVLYFVYVFLVGLTTLSWLAETILTGIADLFLQRQRYLKMVCFILLFAVALLVMIPQLADDGFYLGYVYVTFATTGTVLLLALIDVISISWIYRIDRFLLELHDLNRLKPHRLIRGILWKVVVPLLMLAALVYHASLCIDNESDISQAATWWVRNGWVLLIIPLLLIPIVACAVMLHQSGNLYQKMKTSLKPDAQWGIQGRDPSTRSTIKAASQHNDIENEPEETRYLKKAAVGFWDSKPIVGGKVSEASEGLIVFKISATESAIKHGKVNRASQMSIDIECQTENEQEIEAEEGADDDGGRQSKSRHRRKKSSRRRGEHNSYSSRRKSHRTHRAESADKLSQNRSGLPPITESSVSEGRNKWNNPPDIDEPEQTFSKVVLPALRKKSAAGNSRQKSRDSKRSSSGSPRKSSAKITFSRGS